MKAMEGSKGTERRVAASRLRCPRRASGRRGHRDCFLRYLPDKRGRNGCRTQGRGREEGQHGMLRDEKPEVTKEAQPKISHQLDSVWLSCLGACNLLEAFRL